MKLHEVAKQQAYPNQYAKVKQWLGSQGIQNYTIRPNGIVDVDGDVYLHNFHGTIIPIQFGKVTGDFKCNGSGLTSLKGFPQHIGHDFNCARTKIKSLQYAPQHVSGDFYCHLTDIKSLSGIDKIVKHVGDGFACNDNATHLLGLLLIPGLTDIILSCNIKVDKYKPVQNILNKYLGTGDILSAQDELIDAGFIDQARL